MGNSWGRIRIGIKMECRILIRSNIKRARICKLLRIPGTDSASLCSPVVVSARQATYRYIGWWNRFLGSLNVYKLGL
jgi:hypothetical protein